MGEIHRWRKAWCWPSSHTMDTGTFKTWSWYGGTVRSSYRRSFRLTSCTSSTSSLREKEKVRGRDTRGVLSADEIKRLYKIGSTLKQGAPNSTGSLSDGLVGWWTFDGKDIAGDIAYNRGSTSTADGTISVFGTGRNPVKTLGRIGQALDFDGAASYVEIGSNFVNMPRFSVSLWAYPRTQGDSSSGGFVSGGASCIDGIGTVEGWEFGFYGGFGQRGEICF